MFASIAVAALLAAAAQAAPEAAPAATPAAEAPVKAKPKTRRVCYENKGTGSRLDRKTCVTEKVDEKEADAGSDKAKPGD